jgi:hypothetical protein
VPSVIGPLRAIDASGSSKLRDGDDHGILPGRSKLTLERCKGVVQSRQQSEKTPELLSVRIPPFESQRCDPGTIGLRQ